MSGTDFRGSAYPRFLATKPKLFLKASLAPNCPKLEGERAKKKQFLVRLPKNINFNPFLNLRVMQKVWAK